MVDMVVTLLLPRLLLLLVLPKLLRLSLEPRLALRRSRLLLPFWEWTAS